MTSTSIFEAERKARALRGYVRGGFPLHVLSAIGTARVSHDCEALREKVASLLGGTLEGCAIFITGAVGTGKTLEACRAGLAVIAAGGSARFTTSVDYIARILSTYARSSTRRAEDVVSTFTDASLLVLDDLGAERASAHAVARLFELIDARYRAMRPTIITSNFSLQDLAAHLAGGATTEEREDARSNAIRLCDRLQEIAVRASLTGKSHRMDVRPESWARFRRIVAAIDREDAMPRRAPSEISPEMREHMARLRGQSRDVPAAQPSEPSWREEVAELLPDLSGLVSVVDESLFAPNDDPASRRGGAQPPHPDAPHLPGFTA